MGLGDGSKEETYQTYGREKNGGGSHFRGGVLEELGGEYSFVFGGGDLVYVVKDIYREGVEKGRDGGLVVCICSWGIV